MPSNDGDEIVEVAEADSFNKVERNVRILVCHWSNTGAASLCEGWRERADFWAVTVQSQCIAQFGQVC